MFDNLSKNQLIILFIVVLGAFWIIYTSRSKEYMEDIGGPKHAPENPLTSVTVKNKRNRSPYALYYFYHPQCGWCKKFTPTWKQLTKMLDGKDIEVIDVDVSNEKNDDLAFYYNVNAYPTLIYVTPNKNYEYNGDRTVNDILGFIQSNK
jgi:thiol-disulfide isomerase/thioredoxin